MFKINNKDTRTTPIASFWCLYCQLRTYFTLFSGVFIIDFEHVIINWALKTYPKTFFTNCNLKNNSVKSLRKLIYANVKESYSRGTTTVIVNVMVLKKVLSFR